MTNYTTPEQAVKELNSLMPPIPTVLPTPKEPIVVEKKEPVVEQKPKVEAMVKEVKKPVEPKVTVIPTEVKEATKPMHFGWEGVPLPVYRYFAIELSRATPKDINEVREIYLMTKDKATDGNIYEQLNYLRSLENRLGAARPTETAHAKIWNYLKMQANIKHLRKEGN